MNFKTIIDMERFVKAHFSLLAGVVLTVGSSLLGRAAVVPVAPAGGGAAPAAPSFSEGGETATTKFVKRVCQEVHKHTHSRNVLLPVDVVVDRVNKLLKGWGAFYSVGYPSRVFRKVNHYVLKRMARFLNRKSQRYYRLKFADTYYGEMTHYGLYRLAWADVRRAR